MAISVQLINKNPGEGVVSVYVQDPTGKTNGYLKAQLKSGESSEYEVHGTQTLLISEAHVASEDTKDVTLAQPRQENPTINQFTYSTFPPTVG